MFFLFYVGVVGGGGGGGKIFFVLGLLIFIMFWGVEKIFFCGVKVLYKIYKY